MIASRTARPLFALLLLTLCTACRSKTEFGRCVGAFEQKKMDPTLTYEVSTRNVVWGMLGIEFFLIPPIMVVLKQTHCPVGRVAP